MTLAPWTRRFLFFGPSLVHPAGWAEDTHGHGRDYQKNEHYQAEQGVLVRPSAKGCGPRLGSRIHLSASIVALVAVGQACATPTGKSRVWIGAAAGGAVGAVGGAALSPNEESRGVNALVFGLSGALAGAFIGVWTDKDPRDDAALSTLKDRELGSVGKPRDYLVLPHEELPDFLKRRVQPVVIEEYVESDRVTEEGTLHEPHRAYRIKQPAELFAKPVPVPSMAPQKTPPESVGVAK